MKLLRKSGLTGSEAAIIITLLITFTIGVVIRYSGWKRHENFSYSETDKQFDEKTKLALSDLKQQNLTERQKDRSVEVKNLYDSLMALNDNKPDKKQDLKLNIKVNINTAFAADLMMLPGIGEVTAERIIDFREKNNGFIKPEDLLKVKGIGEKKYEKLKPYITVEP